MTSPAAVKRKATHNAAKKTDDAVGYVNRPTCSSDFMMGKENPQQAQVATRIRLALAGVERLMRCKRKGPPGMPDGPEDPAASITGRPWCC